ncbi:ABC transporter substrate-binding protein [Xylophilus sp.]|uniref:ABC transporter substrate-binding protein n=1 Tax=Xylophilus sp. TaxID=2653893 RepID=UPI0013BD1281|nr:ABC transporter substrate-binding protein [Xylophilus sp.]KAF1050128.1 MAG: Oligopeptide-binding protein AppA [Xylophilus sp.]
MSLLSRRHFIAAPAALAWGASAHAAEAATPQRGGTLVIGTGREPPGLTSALTTAGPTQLVSGKVFDGLLSYDAQLRPLPRLATKWETSADGLAITFHLRPGVKWHDGQPFTSADVAFSLLEVWKKFNARGRSIFLNVEKVDTPSPTVAVLRLSRPAPYILGALSAIESQVIPRHLYAGADVLANPRNNAPVGTGPFRFVRWDRGRQLVLERNADYWDRDRPWLDQIVFRQITDPAAAVAALETGAIHIAGEVPLSDVANLARNPQLAVHRRTQPSTTGIAAIEFNLERPLWRDVRVRQAIAHAVDRNFLVKNIWHGYAEATDAPIPSAFPAFHTTDVPHYPFDLQRAEALLDAAGLKRDGRGTRLAFTLDPNAGSSQTLVQAAQVLRANLARIGVRVDVRIQDFGEFINRVYTRRDFDASVYMANAGPDPAIGTQRFYWSKNIQPGVAFSNGAAYRSAEADRLLEIAQYETNVERRRAIYTQFQQLVQTDLPKIPLVAPEAVVVARKGLRDFLDPADGTLGNFAGAWIARDGGSPA